MTKRLLATISLSLCALHFTLAIPAAVYSQDSQSHVVASGIPLSRLMTAVDVKENTLVGSPKTFKAKVTSNEVYLDLKDSHYIKQTFIKAGKKPARITRETATWANVTEGLDLEISLYNNQLKENIVLHSPKSLPLSWRLESDLQITRKDNSLIFTKPGTDAPGQELVRLLPPAIKDSNGRDFPGAWIFTQGILILNIPDISQAVFPLTIDPSYTIVTGALESSTVNSREIVRDSSGNLHAVYYRSNGSHDEIYYAKSINSGQTWNETALTTDSYDQDYPSIAIDSSNNLHVVWNGPTASSPSNPQIRYIKYSGSWSGITDLTTNASYGQYAPYIAIDSSDNLHVVIDGLTASSPAAAQIRYIKYSGTWSGITELTTNASYDQEGPAIAIDSSNNLHVVWYGYNASSASKYQIRYIKYSGSWSGITELTTDASYVQANSSIAIDSSDNLHVVWEGYDASSSYGQIRYIKYSGGWSGITDLTSASVNQRFPRLIWSMHPTVGGLKINRPKAGYAFVWMNGTTEVDYYASSDLAWDGGGGGSPAVIGGGVIGGGVIN